MAWWNPSSFRAILEGETESGMTVNETTYGQLRKNMERIVDLIVGTGITGSATSDPPDDDTGVLTDTGASYDTDEHANKTLMFMDGANIAGYYTITSNTATTLTCDGINLYDLYVRSGDSYKILYNIERTTGHTHDGLDSAGASVADGAVTQAKLAPFEAGDVLVANKRGMENVSTEDDDPGDDPFAFFLEATSYTKIAAINLVRSGALRIKFEMSTQLFNKTAYGRIYRNGVAVGTERTCTGTNVVEFSEDISGWNIGDECQLYVKTGTTGSAVEIYSFAIYASNAFADAIAF